MHRLTSIFAALLASAAVAAAQTPPRLHEATFYAQGTCTGMDVVALSEPNWEGQTILVANVQLVVIPNNPLYQGSYAFSGINDAIGDIVAWGQAPAAGTSFTVPSNIPPGYVMEMLPGEHIDLHLGCSPKGIGFQSYLIVWYLLDSGPVPTS